MNCKNCNSPLRTDYSYCPNCGAKVIRNRITLKNLWYDVIDRYFNLDNTFIKTFVHLFSKPETVIESYIKGIRRKYLNPISYLGIALTVSGFIAFLMTKLSNQLDFDIFSLGTKNLAQEKILNFTLDYQSLLFVLYIPMMALASWPCFEEKKYNFSERVVVFMYTLAQYSVFIFLPSLFLLAFFPVLYPKFTLISVLIMLVYGGYVIKRISKVKGIVFAARMLAFYAFFLVMYFGSSFIIPVAMLLTGQLSIQDFAPIKT